MSCCMSPWHATRHPSHETACSWQMQVRAKPAGSIKQLSPCPLQWVGRAASTSVGMSCSAAADTVPHAA